MVEATIRQHRSQHDAIADLPLVTRSATVTTVEKLDRERRPEVTAALNRWLEEYGVDDEYGPVSGPDDWAGLREQLVAAEHADLARRVAMLSERYARPAETHRRDDSRCAAREASRTVARARTGLRCRRTSRPEHDRRVRLWHQRDGVQPGAGRRASRCPARAHRIRRVRVTPRPAQAESRGLLTTNPQR